MLRSFLLAVVFICAAAISAGAAQLGMSSGGLGFSCPPDDEMCTCDGTFTDCSNMKVNCVNGTMQCHREGGLERCWCQRQTAARPRLPDRRAPLGMPSIKQ